MENLENVDTKNIRETKKTVLGIDENIEGALCYFLGFLTGILFLILEKDNKFVRFHAMQSTATFVILFVLGFFVSIVPVVGWILIGLVDAILWLLLMFKAVQGEMYKLPVVGDFAEKQIIK